MPLQRFPSTVCQHALRVVSVCAGAFTLRGLLAVLSPAVRGHQDRLAGT